MIERGKAKQAKGQRVVINKHDVQLEEAIFTSFQGSSHVLPCYVSICVGITQMPFFFFTTTSLYNYAYIN